MNIKNARNPEQIKRMQALKKEGLCYFCLTKNNIVKPIIIFEKKYWYVTPNNFPLEGSTHHYMIVPKKHLKDLTEISNEESIELYKVMVPWLKNYLKSSGYSIFIRSGNTMYTGATIEHIHFHFLIGAKKPKNATLKDVVPVVIAYKKKPRN